MQVEPFRVGDWEVWPLEGELKRQGKQKSLEPRVMQLLVYLAEHAGVVVSADQLLIDVWKGPFYGDNPVYKCVALLRRALGDDASAPRYVETLRKRGYRLIAEVSGVGDASHQAKPRELETWRGRCPYVGLSPFRAEHHEVFFGRTHAIAGVLVALRQQREFGQGFLLVLGASGIGKSSLLRAGVLPSLTTRNGFHGLRAGDATWIDLACDPSPHAALRKVLADGAKSTSAPFDNGNSLRVVVIDHLEKLIHASSTRDEQADFDADLGQLCRYEGVFIFALARSDAYSALLEALPGLAELKSRSGQFDIPAVTRGEIAEMIRRPAQLAGLEFEYDEESRLRLDDALLDAASERPGSLPMLQVALQALYDHRTEAGQLGFTVFRQIGGIDGAIAQRAEQIFLALETGPQQALPIVLGRLVRTDDDGNFLSGRRVTRECLVTVDGLVLVDALIGARLLVADNWRGQPVFGMAHDALIREWPRASQWVRENKRLLSARERLGTAALRWQQMQENADHLLPSGAPLEEAREVEACLPDSMTGLDRRYLALSARRAARKRRLLVIGMVALIASALCAFVFALQARSARAIAEHQRVEGEGMVDFLLNDFSKQLRAIGRLDLLNSVSSEVSHYLDNASVPSSPEHVFRRVRALRILAEVNAGRGELNAGIEAIGKAQTLLNTIDRNSVDPLEFGLEQGTVLYWRGNLALQSGDLQATDEAWEGYRQSAQRMLDVSPENTTAQLEMSYALNNLGNLALREQRNAEAGDLFRKSIALKRNLYQLHPDRLDIGADLADSISWWGSTLDRQGKLDQAVEQFATQTALLRAVSERRPEDRTWEYRLTTALTQMATLQRALGKLEQSRSGYLESIRHLESLVRSDSTNKAWARDLAFAEIELGWLEAISSHTSAARSVYASAQATIQSLLAGAEVLPAWRVLDLRLRLRSLMLDAQSDGPGIRGRQVEAALRDAEVLSRELPGQPEVQRDLALALNMMARVELDAMTGPVKEPLERALGVLHPWAQSADDGQSVSADKETLMLLLLTFSGLGRTQQADDVRRQLDSMGFRDPALEYLLKL